MTSTLHLGDFMGGGAINQGRINTGGDSRFREWVMEKNVFKHVIFAVPVDHMFFAQELIEYVSDYDY